jgi:sialic acid synthase SpsE
LLKILKGEAVLAQLEACDASANVRTVPHLGEAFDCVSGLSDHTLGSAAAVASIALGGSIIEKHFTLTRSGGGPDSVFSMEPDELKALVDDCKHAWMALGKISYELAGSERTSLVFRRSLYVVADVAAGEILEV